MIKWSDLLKPEWVFCNIGLFLLIAGATSAGMSLLGSSLVVILAFQIGYVMGKQ